MPPSRGSTRRNLIANLIGSAWTGVIHLTFIPIYVSFVGIEAYGLIGLFATLQALMFLLDLGLAMTVNREIAKASGQEGDAGELRDLVRTVEAAYWLIASALGLSVVLAAPEIAHHWLRARQLDPDAVESTIRIMGVMLTLLGPTAFYSGALYGLQRHVLLNAVRSAMATVQAVGAVVVLSSVSATIHAFFTWQAAAAGLQTGLLAGLTWRALPSGHRRPRLRLRSLRHSWQFAAGMTVITILSLVLTHMDKLVLSKMLTLDDFGYYSLATAIAMGLYKITAPVFTALFPRMTQLVSAQDEAALRRLYHSGALSMSVLLLPVAVVIALFAPDVVLVWVGDTETAARISTIVRLLTIGTALNGLMNVPYALQLAHAWTRLALLSNFIATLILVPGLIWAAGRYGGVGAAWVWVVLNASYVLVVQPIAHSRLLRGELLRWYGRDVGLPLLATLIVAGSARALFSLPETRFGAGAALVALVLATAGAAALSSPEGRTWLRRQPAV